MEIYQAYSDYIGMMELTEQMISAVCQEVCGTTTITYQGTEIDMAPPWRRATMHDLVQDATGLDFSSFSSREEAAAAMTAKGLHALNWPTRWAVCSMKPLSKRWRRP